jgi:hypothetical protein
MGNFYHNSKVNRLVVAEKTADLYLLLSVQILKRSDASRDPVW